MFKQMESLPLLGCSSRRNTNHMVQIAPIGVLLLGYRACCKVKIMALLALGDCTPALVSEADVFRQSVA